MSIVLLDGHYFGNLCAMDTAARRVSDASMIKMLQVFAGLIALQLETRGRQQAAEIAFGNERVTAELREQVIAVLDHNLRNPLSAVSGTAEIPARRREPELATMGVYMLRIN